MKRQGQYGKYKNTFFTIRVFITVILLAGFVVSCVPDNTPVEEKDYRSAILGSWQATVGNYSNENISFKKDNIFKTQLHAGGFIGNTMSQGAFDMTTGSWMITGDLLTVRIKDAEREGLFNKNGTFTILSLTGQELKISDEKGDTTVFVRFHGM